MSNRRPRQEKIWLHGRGEGWATNAKRGDGFHFVVEDDSFSVRNGLVNVSMNCYVRTLYRTKEGWPVFKWVRR